MSSPLPSAAVPAATPRIAALDRIRGAVMVLMAIDHVRVFAGVPAGGPSPGVFFTRWITHFCAPAFFFLAGTSAFLYGRKHANLSRFLLTRGAWLVLLELTFLRWMWTFNFDRAHPMAGVIWAFGWCMILMAGLVKLPLPVVGTLGVAIVAGHDLLDPHLGPILQSLGDDPRSALWKIGYVGFFAGPIELGGSASLIVLYSLVPWIGVMAAGYAFGRVMIAEPSRRDRWCLALGLGATLLFLVLRGFDLYGDPRPWRANTNLPGLLAFLSPNKYPASLSFLLMTLGPTLALVPRVERLRGPLARGLTDFGRVPFFFYLLHIPLIHALALAVSRLREGAVNPWLFANHPLQAPDAPEGYTWSLGLLYLVWAIAIALLWLACRWFAGVKERRRGAWLSYL